MTPAPTSPLFPAASPCREHTARLADCAELDRFVGEIYAALEPFLAERGFVKPEFRIALVLHEAVLNAWSHGNGRDRSKAVRVRWRVTEEPQLVLEVLDQGKGFDLRAVGDPRECGNILCPDGRGIAIMSYLADRLSWQEGGRRLVACFGRVPSRQTSAATKPDTS